MEGMCSRIALYVDRFSTYILQSLERIRGQCKVGTWDIELALSSQGERTPF